MDKGDETEVRRKENKNGPGSHQQSGKHSSFLAMTRENQVDKNLKSSGRQKFV